MADIVSKSKRSQMMAGIKAKDTKLELLIRKAIHAKGFRYRLHETSLPGKPDLVFPRYKAVLFINGCFWHAHDCHLFKLPATDREKWNEKFVDNRASDVANLKDLYALGWRTGVVWECSVRGKKNRGLDKVVAKCCKWLESNRRKFEIRGK
jgi:DNA mismatch endonuclease (patch repair protein)